MAKKKSDEVLKTPLDSKDQVLLMIKGQVARSFNECEEYQREYQAIQDYFEREDIPEEKRPIPCYRWRAAYASWETARRILYHACNALGIEYTAHSGGWASAPPDRF